MLFFQNWVAATARAPAATAAARDLAPVALVSFAAAAPSDHPDKVALK